MPRKLTAARNASSTRAAAPLTPPDPAANPLSLLATTFAEAFPLSAAAAPPTPVLPPSPLSPVPPLPLPPAPSPPSAAAVASCAARRQRILLRARIGGCFVSHLDYVCVCVLFLLLLLVLF